ncbi:MAG: hypothetical protein ABJJ25_13310 [Eudoraea sp.]|uniref:DUF7670 domain-containing protein n=1 Tax=Eudoraea sp. TaxID=1979955 RepID=UPI003266BE22
MKNQRLTTIILWTARILGSVIIAFVLFFLVAHVFGNNESGEGFRDSKEIITFLLFPISTVIGLAIAWKWEGLGGIITTVGMIGLFSLRPDLLNSFYITIPIIPGLLFIAYWLITKNNETPNN